MPALHLKFCHKLVLSQGSIDFDIAPLSHKVEGSGLLPENASLVVSFNGDRSDGIE